MRILFTYLKMKSRTFGRVGFMKIEFFPTNISEMYHITKDNIVVTTIIIIFQNMREIIHAI